MVTLEKTSDLPPPPCSQPSMSYTIATLPSPSPFRRTELHSLWVLPLLRGRSVSACGWEGRECLLEWKAQPALLKYKQLREQQLSSPQTPRTPGSQPGNPQNRHQARQWRQWHHNSHQRPIGFQGLHGAGRITGLKELGSRPPVCYLLLTCPRFLGNE